MLISQFAMAFLAAWLLMLLNGAMNPAVPMGGPYYYAETGGRPNPVRPGNRISAAQAFRARRHLQVIYNDRGLPVLIKRMQGRQELYAEIFDWDRTGQLYRRVLRLPGGRLIKREDYPRGWIEKL